MMTERCTFGRILLSSVALVAAVACQQAVRSALLAEGQPTVCYHLAFAPWTSTSQAPFAKAAVGLVNPLPDTIALTGSVTTPYGRAYYVAVRVSADSVHPGGTWTPARHDTLLVDFPSDVGNGLIDRKSTRLNSSHLVISYAVFCLKKKKNIGLRALDRESTLVILMHTTD